jgi:hypothetical protein
VMLSAGPIELRLPWEPARGMTHIHAGRAVNSSCQDDRSRTSSGSYGGGA